MILLKRILVPTDFSEFSKIAADYACELAAKFDAELHLLHVLQSHPTATPRFAMGLALPGSVQESRADAEEALASVVDPQRRKGRTIVRVVEGAPFVQIVRYARENEIDLIVVGTHGHSGLVHVLMGSVAENVVRKSPCPVLTVRPEGHQFVMP